MVRSRGNIDGAIYELVRGWLLSPWLNCWLIGLLCVVVYVCQVLYSLLSGEGWMSFITPHVGCGLVSYSDVENLDVFTANALLYSFFHANIFHLVVNLLALWKFKPRNATCNLALACAIVLGFIPGVTVSEPTCGLSGFLFAAYAHSYAYYRSSIWRLLAICALCGLLPHMNAIIHIAAFLAAYLIWRAYYGKTLR